MLNDPYLDVIRSTKDLNLDESVIENSINLFLKNGIDEAFHDLVHNRKVQEADAWKLVGAIKKEFRSTYYTDALYSGVFMALWSFLTFIFYWSSDYIGFWAGFFFFLFLFSLYSFIKNLAKAAKIKR